MGTTNLPPPKVNCNLILMDLFKTFPYRFAFSYFLGHILIDHRNEKFIVLPTIFQECSHTCYSFQKPCTFNLIKIDPFTLLYLFSVIYQWPVLSNCLRLYAHCGTPGKGNTKKQHNFLQTLMLESPLIYTKSKDPAMASSASPLFVGTEHGCTPGQGSTGTATQSPIYY